MFQAVANAKYGLISIYKASVLIWIRVYTWIDNGCVQMPAKQGRGGRFMNGGGLHMCRYEKRLTWPDERKWNVDERK